MREIEKERDKEGKGQSKLREENKMHKVSTMAQSMAILVLP